MTDPRLFTVSIRDQEVYYLKADGVYQVLIKPICDVFELDSDRQIRNIKNDEIFGAEVSEQSTQVPGDNQRRLHTCLPEEFIYGWLSGIKFSNTMATETKQYLIEYKKECYRALYEHFHGRVGEADQRLKEKVLLQKELDGLRSRHAAESGTYREILLKEERLKKLGDPYARVGRERKKELTEDLFPEG